MLFSILTFNMDYSHAWTFTFKSYYHKITTLQNKTVKIIGGGKWNYRAVTPFYEYAKSKILKLVDLVEIEKACFIFKHKTQKLPPSFDIYFVPAFNIHQSKNYKRFWQ